MTEQPRSTEEALQQALAAHGVTVGGLAARAATEAVLRYRNEDMACSMSAPRHQWENPDFQSYARERAWRDLVDSITRQGKVPVSLPHESLRHLESWSFREVAESEGWDTVEFTLRVGVRTPPVGPQTALSAPGAGARDA